MAPIRGDVRFRESEGFPNGGPKYGFHEPHRRSVVESRCAALSETADGRQTALVQIASRAMKRYLKSLLQMMISMAILGALVFWMDREKAKWLLHEARYGYLVLTFLLCLADRFLMGFKFRFLLAAVSMRIPLMEMFRIYYISSLQGILIPFGVGPDLLKYWRIRKLGAPHADLVAAILTERFLGMAATGCLILVSIGLLGLRLSKAFSFYLVGFFGVIAGTILAIAALIFIAPGPG